MSSTFAPAAASSSRRKFRLGEDIDVDLVAVYPSPERTASKRRNDEKGEKKNKRKRKRRRKRRDDETSSSTSSNNSSSALSATRKNTNKVILVEEGPRGAFLVLDLTSFTGRVEVHNKVIEQALGISPSPQPFDENNNMAATSAYTSSDDDDDDYEDSDGVGGGGGSSRECVTIQEGDEEESSSASESELESQNATVVGTNDPADVLAALSFSEFPANNGTGISLPTTATNTANTSCCTSVSNGSSQQEVQSPPETPTQQSPLKPNEVITTMKQNQISAAGVQGKNNLQPSPPQRSERSPVTMKNSENKWHAISSVVTNQNHGRASTLPIVVPANNNTAATRNGYSSHDESPQKGTGPPPLPGSALRLLNNGSAAATAAAAALSMRRRSQSVDSADTPPVFSKDSSSYNFFVSGDEGTPNDESSLFTNDPSYNFFVSDDASQRSLSEHAEEDTAQAQQEAVSSSSSACRTSTSMALWNKATSKASGAIKAKKSLKRILEKASSQKTFGSSENDKKVTTTARTTTSVLNSTSSSGSSQRSRRKPRSLGLLRGGLRGALRSTIRSSMSNSLTGGGGRFPSSQTFTPPTRLHELCAAGNATLNELHRALEAEPESAEIKDANGRLPLHILGDNDGLVGSPHGRQIASAFASELMEVYPDGMTAVDDNGHMPFVTIIYDWIVWTYETHERFAKLKQESNKGPSGVTAAIMALHSGTTTAANNTSPSTEMRGNIVAGAGGLSMEPYFSHASRNESLDRNVDNPNNNTSDFYSKAFPRVDMSDEVEWAFTMLSVVMDELGGKNRLVEPPERKAAPRRRKRQSFREDDKRFELAEHMIAVLPALFKTIFLLEGENGITRKRILKLSVFRRMLLCPEAVGDWITHMLRQYGTPSSRVVDYFALVSETNVIDFTGGFKPTSKEDMEAYQAVRQEVFVEVEALKGTISSLVMLDTSDTERAAATAVVWRIMSNKLGRPFVLGLVLIDLILHITLMLAFRNDVQISYDTIGIGDVPTQVVVFICSHYFLRKACEAKALFTVSPAVFRKYYTDMWTLFDVVAIILTLAATIWNDSHPGEYRNGFNAFIVGLLWIKVLGFLKVVNKQMSTFILALIRILCDIRYFMVVLVVIIFMFGDMYHIAVSTKDNGQYCKIEPALSGPTEDFCSPVLTNSYLRVYSILIGDFELSELRDTTGITILFVILTLIGVVILLNILIAVVSDSYERATVSSAMTFGRARLYFVAQNESLEGFLKPGSAPWHGLHHDMSRCNCVLQWLNHAFRRLVLYAIIATAFYAEYYLITRIVVVFREPEVGLITAIIMLCFCFFLMAALWVVTTFAVGGVVRSKISGRVRSTVDMVDKFNNTFVRAVSSRLFGLDHKSTVATAKDKDMGGGSDDWTGRMNYLERRFQLMIRESNKELTGEILALEARLADRDFAERERTEQRQ